MLTIKINDLLEMSKYTNIFKSDIKVYTPSGLKKVYDVAITAKNSDVFLLKTKKHELICSPDHLIKSNGDWVKCKNLNIGDIIDTKYGKFNLEEISMLDYTDDLLDLHVDTNEYYTNDIISHNSSLLSSFEFALYGKVRSGKSKKWSTLSTLPNRINGSDLQVKIKFKADGNEVEVIRGMSPNILQLIENGLENDRAGKSNLNEKIEDYVGLDVETFKSFISMSIDSFKNFISLSNEEKQLLLDKLFNLEIINILNTILKDLNKTNKLQINRYDYEIQTIQESIDSIRRSIEKSIEKQKQNIQEEIDIIKNDIDSKKDEYQKLKDKVDKIKIKEKELKDDLDKEREQYSNIQNEIRLSQRDIDLYDSGKCPTCGTDFNNDHFHNLKELLIEKKNSVTNIKIEIDNNIKLIKERQLKLQKMSDDANSSFNDITYLLRNYKLQIDKLQLQKDKESGQTSPNVVEFENTIIELNSKKTLSEERSSESKDKDLYYKELSKIFGEDGVKKTIISNIIKPINYFISENIKRMGLQFQVTLDETFTADIKSLSSTVDHDSLSTGESKLINISILVAYLKLIKTKKHINILFLDEVFASIDLSNIGKILILLKSFANEFNVNIFVVHHSILNIEEFDRIIKIEKEVFSKIVEYNKD